MPVSPDNQDHRDGSASVPLLLLMFVGSGCSALIYEIVWFQLLQLVIGSSTISLGVLLATFMGGMCVGSLLFPRLVSSHRHPLRVYALLELSIGVLGIVLLTAMPLVGRIYVEDFGASSAELFLRCVISAVCLLPPTILMGATLPAIARWVEASPAGISRLGFFYGSNIAGAVFGCLLAGFCLLRLFDMATATYVAASINAGVAFVSFAMAIALPYSDGVRETASRPPGKTAATPLSTSSRFAYPAILLSGMTALAAEVIWTRQLSLLMGASVYTFSIILAVFLVGLGIGSSIASTVVPRLKNPQIALGCCQMLLIPAIVWTAITVTRSLPYWPIDVSLATSPWLTFQLDLVRCAWAVSPAACLWGASFPLALASAAAGSRDPGRLVGSVYAANTVGAIAGALCASVLMIAWLGTQDAQRVLVALAGVSALIMFVPLMLQASQPHSRRAAAAMLSVVTLAGTGLSAYVPQIPTGLIAYGRYLPTYRDEPDYLYFGEGMNASIAVSEDAMTGVRNFHVSGKIVASSEPADMRLQRMLGHLPALVHPRPRSVLVVGCGAGVTAGSFLPHPEIERIVICEIEPLIPPAAGKYFSRENHHVTDDPRVEIVNDDARHFIMTTTQHFDIITSDPIHPWVKGAATLYSREYFEWCRKRLNPGGVVTQWVPLYETSDAAVKSELATFFSVFPEGTVWSNDIGGEGYDIVLLGQSEPTRIDVQALHARLLQNDRQSVRESLAEVKFDTPVDLLLTYAGNGRDLQDWLADAELNRDANLRLQYLAGMGLNQYDSVRIFDDIVIHRTFPEGMLIAMNDSERAIRSGLLPRGRK
ncbi:MAG: fused MFS/spermidine synthase [Planctomycetaceae bacterium]